MKIGRPKKEVPMIIVGATERAVISANESIMNIISCNRSDQIILEALSCLKAICQVNNTTISNCNFTRE